MSEPHEDSVGAASDILSDRDRDDITPEAIVASYHESSTTTEQVLARRLADALVELNRLRAFLHERQMHPDFEYETTHGGRKAFDDTDPPSGEGWEKNRHRGRDGYWRRRKIQETT